MSTKLTDMQLVLLSAASQREDHYLSPPTGPRLGPAKRAARKLLAEGLVQEVRARKGAPVWRRDEDADQAFGLKLTAVGLKAIAADAGAADEDVARETQSGDDVEHEATPDRIGALEVGPGVEAIREPAPPRVPRAGTKISDVIDMLGRDAGATVDEIIAATAWLPHTTRAALTGLRKRGYALVSDRSDPTRSTVYRIARPKTSDEAIGAVDAAPDHQGSGEAAPRGQKAGAAGSRRRRAS